MSAEPQVALATDAQRLGTLFRIFEALCACGEPTTIYGSGLGADASPRVIELQAKFVF